MTCLLDVELGVDVFAGVKGVGDVLAGVSRVLRSSSQLSTVSVTCLLGVELLRITSWCQGRR